MHQLRSASERDPVRAARPCHAPLASIASTVPFSPLPPARSEPRQRGAWLQDPAPAAPSARSPAALTSATPPRWSPTPVSAGTLPHLLSSPAQSGYRYRAGPPRDPAPAALTACAPAVAM